MLRFEGVEDTPVAPVPHRSMTFEEACERRAGGGGVSLPQPETPAPETPADNLGRVAGPFTREIKLWDPSMLPLGARSSSKDDYRAWPLPKAQPSVRAAYQPSPHKCQGTTTSQEAYQAWKVEPAAPPPSQPVHASPHKFTATTVNQDTYRAWPLEPPQPSVRAAYQPSPHKCQGTTTSQEAYQAWRIEPAAAPPAQPRLASPHKFTATTVNQDMYRAWKLEPAPAARQAVWQPSPHKCEGTTTSSEAYQAWPVQPPLQPAATPRSSAGLRFEGQTEAQAQFVAKPLPTPMATPAATPARSLPFAGESETSAAYKRVELPTSVLPALGVLTQGGAFHCLIPAASLPPARRSATFTTVTDNQTEVEIKVVALDAAGPVTLGSFILQGITPARVGLPQVVVTFELSEELVLLVTAHDRIDDQFKQLVIKDRLPTPPKERPT